MAKKKAISKAKKSKVAAKTTKKTKMNVGAKKNTSSKSPPRKPKKSAATERETPVLKPKLKTVEPSQSLTATDEHADQAPQSHMEFQDNNQTSLKRRRTSGQAYTGAGREEKRRVASMEVMAHKDERERIRAPRRSQNQNRSR